MPSHSSVMLKNCFIFHSVELAGRQHLWTTPLKKPHYISGYGRYQPQTTSAMFKNGITGVEALNTCMKVMVLNIYLQMHDLTLFLILYI